MSQYAGICIGGPIAGQSHVFWGTVCEVDEYDPGKLAAGPTPGRIAINSMDAKTTRHTYNWLNIGGIGLWIISTMTLEDALKDILVAYAEKHDVG